MLNRCKQLMWTHTYTHTLQIIFFLQITNDERLELNNCRDYVRKMVIQNVCVGYMDTCMHDMCAIVKCCYYDQVSKYTDPMHDTLCRLETKASESSTTL